MGQPMGGGLDGEGRGAAVDLEDFPGRHRVELLQVPAQRPYVTPLHHRILQSLPFHPASQGGRGLTASPSMTFPSLFLTTLMAWVEKVRMRMGPWSIILPPKSSTRVISRTRLSAALNLLVVSCWMLWESCLNGTCTQPPVTTLRWKERKGRYLVAPIGEDDQVPAEFGLQDVGDDDGLGEAQELLLGELGVYLEGKKNGDE